MSESSAPGVVPPDPEDGPGDDGGATVDRATLLATGAVVGGAVLAAAGLPRAAAVFGRAPVRPVAARFAVDPLVRVGVSVAALGAVHGGTGPLPAVSLSPAERHRRAVVAGALVVAVDTVGAFVPVLGILFTPGRGLVSALLSPLVVGWVLVAAGVVGAATADGTGGSRVAGPAVGGYDRVAGATAGPFPTALRGGLAAVATLLVGAGVTVVARLLAVRVATDAPGGIGVAVLGAVVLVVGGGLLGAVAAVLPDRSRVPSAPEPQRVVVLAGVFVGAVVPVGVAVVPGSPAWSLVRLGTTLVLAGLAWWAGEAVATRL